MNQIELIKTKIKQQYDLNYAKATEWESKEDRHNYGVWYEGKVEMCRELLSILDTIEEQQVCEELEEYASQTVAELVPSLGQKHPDGHYVGGIRDYFSREEFIGLVKAGAKWQKEKDESIYRKFFNDRNQGDPSFYDLLAYREGHRDGMDEQKEQMMKNAVPFYQILKEVPPGPQRETTRVIIIK